MKKLNKTGFTLIELLAVITIMGILMLVAIPAVSRTIENSRRDTFMDTAKSYLNAVKNSVAADELRCGDDPISASLNGFYYYTFKTAGDDDSAKDLMEQGGKSSWGNADVVGHVLVHKTVTSSNRTTYEYAVILVDKAGRGIGTASDDGAPITFVSEKKLNRTSVKTSNGENRLKYYTNNSTLDTKKPTKAASKWDDKTLSTYDAQATAEPQSCSIITT